MYIGAKPNVANFVMLDSITTSATATFNLTKDGVAYYPPNSLACLVSLNGINQKAGSSFNIVNNTIVFSQALTSNDVIDYILVMAEKIDLSVPADSSVTNAKTNFVSTSSNAGLSIKGDGTTDGTLQLNCSQNSHGIKIKSPPHSASASYTLTMPNNDGDADQFLQTDGSGSLSWASADGGAMELISTVNVTSTPTSIEIQDCFSSSYENYRVIIKFVPVSGGQSTPYIQFANASGGSSYRTSNYNFGMLRGYYNSSTSGSESLRGWNESNFRMIEGQRTGASEFQMLDIKIFSPKDSSFRTNYMIDGLSRDSNYLSVTLTMGQVGVVEAHTGIKTFVDSGTFASGSSMSVYGIKK